MLLKAGTAVDATLIAAPSSTKNRDKKRDPEMRCSQKGNEWHFGMKAHIGVDTDSGLVHTVIGTSGNEADVVEGNSLLHGQGKDGFGDAGYQGVHKRPDARVGVTWHIALRPGKRRALDKENNCVDALIDQVEKIKASIRAKVEHPFRVIKRQFGRSSRRCVRCPTCGWCAIKLLAAKACAHTNSRTTAAGAQATSTRVAKQRPAAAKTVSLALAGNFGPVAFTHPSCSENP